MEKTLFKLTKALTFYLPVTICFIMFIDTTLCLLGVVLNIFSYIAGCSLLPLIYFWINTYTFKYCIHSRIPIYYILSVNILNTIEFYYEVLGIYYAYVFCIGSGMMVLLYSYLKYQDNKKLKEYKTLIKKQQDIIESLK